MKNIYKIIKNNALNNFQITNVQYENSHIVCYFNNVFLHKYDDGTFKIFVDRDEHDSVLTLAMSVIDIMYFYSKIDDIGSKILRIFMFGSKDKKGNALNIVKGIMAKIFEYKNDNINNVINKIEFAYEDNNIFYNVYVAFRVAPCVTIYEFMLYGYANVDPSTFGLLEDVDDKECGVVHSTTDKMDKEKIKGIISSCDVIKSKFIGGFDNELLNINMLYENYLQWNTKVNKWTDNNILLKYDDTVYREIIGAIQKATDVNKHFFSIDNTINEEAKQFGAYVRCISVPNENKIILFGDFHGSFHTFFRHMIRLAKLNVLDLHTYEIKNGYMLIFLGDILDRGVYSLEILQFVCKLILSNNGKVIYLRGNHEETKLWADYGFNKELEDKVDNVKEIKGIIQTFYNSSLSAIILQNGDNRYWLCHGGIPVRNEFVMPKLGETLFILDFEMKNLKIILLVGKLDGTIL